MAARGLPLVRNLVTVQIDLLAEQPRRDARALRLRETRATETVRVARLVARFPGVARSLHSHERARLVLRPKRARRHLEQIAPHAQARDLERVRRVELRKTVLGASPNARNTPDLPSHSDVRDAAARVVVEAEVRSETSRRRRHCDVDAVARSARRKRRSEVASEAFDRAGAFRKADARGLEPLRDGERGRERCGERERGGGEKTHGSLEREGCEPRQSNGRARRISRPFQSHGRPNGRPFLI